MFNLDSLNERRPEIVQAQTWMTGCIPESLDSFIESLVQRVNRKRFRFELGDSSNGPRLIAPQSEAAQPNADKKTPPEEQGLRLLNIPSQPGQHANPQETQQPTNLDHNVKDLSPFELLTLGPRPSSPVISAPSPTLSTSLSCSEDLNPTDEEAAKESSRKRIKKEIERFGRNIKQRLCCAIFEKEDNHARPPTTWYNMAKAGTSTFYVDSDAGLWEADQ